MRLNRIRPFNIAFYKSEEMLHDHELVQIAGTVLGSTLRPQMLGTCGRNVWEYLRN
jgi:hypothetical protein